jgi:hypothetical protein
MRDGRDSFPTSCEKMNVIRRGVPSTEHLDLASADRPSRILVRFASAGGVPTNASSAAQRLAATGPLTGGGGRFAI